MCICLSMYYVYIHTYTRACMHFCTLRSQQGCSLLSAMAAFVGRRASSDLADPTITPSLASVSEEACNAPCHCTVQEWPHYLLSDTHSMETTYALHVSSCSTLRKVESTLTAAQSVETMLRVAHAPATQLQPRLPAYLRSTAFSLLLTVSRAARCVQGSRSY